MSIRTIQVTTEEELQQAFAIRTEVFVEEQQVPVDLEIDEYEQESLHVLAFDPEGCAVATGRIREYGDGYGKLQRIAVSKSARTGGYGRAIMTKLEAIGREQLGCTRYVLEAQTHAQVFYEKLGYKVVSEEPYLDAGIWHVKMEKEA